MNENTKWLAVICQNYCTCQDASIAEIWRVIADAGDVRDYLCKKGLDYLSDEATQVVNLKLRAANAQEAVYKAIVWVKESGIKNAYVSQVCRDGLDEINADKGYEDLCEKPDMGG